MSEVEPYIPRATDYSWETGAMAERRSLYWVAGNVGRHVGRCMLTSSQTCQKYLDMIIGIAGRDAETYANFWGSVRWQLVTFPRSWSPLLRVFCGAVRAQIPQAVEWRPVYGAGLGVATFLHDTVDLRFEARIGYAEHLVSQGLIGVQIKTDRFLEDFARKMAEYGRLGIESAIQGVAAPFKSGDAPEKSDSETAPQE